MLKIGLFHNAPHIPLERQTPGSKAEWGNCKFHINEEIENCDWLVVYEGLISRKTVNCPKNNTILITGEPPSVKQYDQKFLNQFRYVISCDQNIRHPGLILSHQSLPWMTGANWDGKQWHETRGAYDTIIQDDFETEKTKLVSGITSDKMFTEGHRKRVAYFQRLQDSSFEVDIFGRGIKNFGDKLEVTASYKYHIVVENSSHPNYWTEKLADALIAECHVFYYGCPNIYDFFPREAITLIDIEKFDDSLQIIQAAISENKYEKSRKEIIEAKLKCVNEYNVFSVLSKIIEKQPPTEMRTKITLEPERRRAGILVITMRFLIRVLRFVSKRIFRRHSIY